VKVISGREDLRTVKRVVVKIGTRSLTGKGSKLDLAKMKKFVADVMGLRKRGIDVLVVSSGAIGAGVGRLGLSKRPTRMSSLQATAAVGQVILMQMYEKNFSSWNQPISQMLLSAEDFSDSTRYENFKNTLSVLLRWGVVPIINENDTVAVEEIRLGDNDILSAYVAKGAKADLLVILTEARGLYEGEPEKSALIPLVRRVTPKFERAALKSSGGFGGMYTKVQAARMASESGVAVVIASGREKNVLERIVRGDEVGTLFLPRRD
jgi:glutamate 5-kinase